MGFRVVGVWGFRRLGVRGFRVEGFRGLGFGGLGFGGLGFKIAGIDVNSDGTAPWRRIRLEDLFLPVILDLVIGMTHCFREGLPKSPPRKTEVTCGVSRGRQGFVSFNLL